MVHNYKSLQETISEMCNLANALLPYSYPKKSLSFEKDIMILKRRYVCLDGYDLLIHFNKAHYKQFDTDILQIAGQYYYSLPHLLVFKIATAFLGENKICFSQFVRNNRVTYFFQVFYSKSGDAFVPEQVKGKHAFEKYEYYELDTSRLGVK